MRLLLVASLLFIIISCTSQQQQPVVEREPTTFIIVRHAEKILDDPNDSDPLLTEDGQSRANRLSRLLRRAEIDAIFATQYQRNVLTVQPTASSKGLEVLPYNSKDRHEIIDKLLSEYQGKTVLLSAHSNSTPELVNILTGGDMTHLDESDYNNIFIVTASEKGKGTLLRLNY